MDKMYDLCAFIVTLAVLCFSCCMSSEHLNEFSDQSALLSLKQSITEDPYKILTHNWTANTSECNWFGVYCGVRHRRITAFDLGGMNLVGMIPPEVGNLSFLSFLNISHNKFHGSLPFELGHLRRLKVISMRVNDISGEIPPSIGKLKELQHLDVGHNSLTVAWQVWSEIADDLGLRQMLQQQSFRQMYEWWISKSRAIHNRWRKKMILVSFFAITWSLWTKRNLMVFQNHDFEHHIFCQTVRWRIALWSKARKENMPYAAEDIVRNFNAIPVLFP